MNSFAGAVAVSFSALVGVSLGRLVPAQSRDRPATPMPAAASPVSTSSSLAVNTPPTIALLDGDTVVFAGESITVRLTTWDADGDSVVFRWRPAGAEEWSLAPANGARIPAAEIGLCALEFQAIDMRGGRSPLLIHECQVKPRPAAPALAFDEESLTDNALLTGDDLFVRVRNEHRARVYYQVGAANPWRELNGSTIALRNLSAGTHELRMRAVDRLGQSTVVIRNVVVGPRFVHRQLPPLPPPEQPPAYVASTGGLQGSARTGWSGGDANATSWSSSGFTWTYDKDLVIEIPRCESRWENSGASSHTIPWPRR